MRFSPRHRRDNNHHPIADRLRELGCSVADTSQVGGSFPDLCVGFMGRTYLIEVKERGKCLTPEQGDWHDEWRGTRPVVMWTTEQAECWIDSERRRIIDDYR